MTNPSKKSSRRPNPPTGGARPSLADLVERWRTNRSLRIAGVVGALALAALVAWLVVSPGGGSKPSARPSGKPFDVSPAGLASLEKLLRQPIYWLGEEPGATYEFTQTLDRRIYVRYLPSGGAADVNAAYLTVGTYPLANAYAVTRKASFEQGNLRILAPGGAVAFAAGQRARSAYVAFPGVPYQVEVFDPVPGQAIRLVGSGALVRAGDESANGSAIAPVLLGASALRDRASSLGLPVYWIGPRPGVSYELSRTATGRVYVRYLPDGVAAGAKGAYLTVATYAGVAGYESTSALAGRHPIRLPGGGVAAVTPKSPKSVYAGFQGVAAQIEVYSPVAGEARRLVTGGRLRPLR